MPGESESCVADLHVMAECEFCFLGIPQVQTDHSHPGYFNQLLALQWCSTWHADQNVTGTWTYWCPAACQAPCEVCMHAQSLSHVWLLATLWTRACQAPLSMEFSGQEYWGGLPFPPPGDLPDPGIKPTSPALLHWQVDCLSPAPPWKPILAFRKIKITSRNYWPTNMFMNIICRLCK